MQRRYQRVVQRVWGKPWFFLLFFAEFVKQCTFYAIGNAGIESVVATGILSLLSFVLWLYCWEEIRWGLAQLTDT